MKKTLNTIFISFCIQIFFIVTHVSAEDNVIHIYQDADLSIHSQSSKAIQLGIEVAFSEVNNEINGNKILFKYLDHRGNVLRSKRNYKAFINDPNALVIYSGIHSPPLINNRKFINESKALTLVPWAAGAPITRYPSKENWIFRLSIDDMQAGGMIIDYAMKNQQCQKPHLLLENTPWGNSNLVNMSKALKFYDIQSPQVTRFNLSVKAKGAQVLTDSIINQGSDCIILVSNAVEGAFICVEINYNGSHTIAWNTVFEFAASTAPTFTSTDAKTDIMVFRYSGAVWQEVGRTLNLSEA